MQLPDACSSGDLVCDQQPKIDGVAGDAGKSCLEPLPAEVNMIKLSVHKNHNREWEREREFVHACAR